MGKARAFPICPMLSHLPFCRMERIRAKQEKHRQGRANRGRLQGSSDPGQEPGECTTLGVDGQPQSSLQMTAALSDISRANS